MKIHEVKSNPWELLFIITSGAGGLYLLGFPPGEVNVVLGVGVGIFVGGVLHALFSTIMGR